MWFVGERWTVEKFSVAAKFVAFLHEVPLQFIGVFVELRKSMDFELVRC